MSGRRDFLAAPRGSGCRHWTWLYCIPLRCCVILLMFPATLVAYWLKNLNSAVWALCHHHKPSMLLMQTRMFMLRHENSTLWACC